MKKFHKGYKYDVVKNLKAQTANNSIFLEARIGDVRAGFLRINDKSSFYNLNEGEAVFNAADAYVEPRFRGGHLLEKLLDHAILEYHVHVACLAPQVYPRYADWYAGKGFTYHSLGSRSGLWWLRDEFARSRSWT